MRANRYVIALGFTLVIFSLGSLMGIVLNDTKLASIQQSQRLQEVDFESLQFQYAYLSSLETGDRCVVLEKALHENLKILDKALEKLQSYENVKDTGEEYHTLKRKYTIANLRYWLLAEQSKNECNTDRASLLYFHMGDDCPTCGDQGTLLSHLKVQFGEKLLVFPIDARFTEEPMVNILQAQYNVKKYPTIVIEGRTIEGFISEQNLLTEICALYKEPSDLCVA